jgi:hypothetical protein
MYCKFRELFLKPVGRVAASGEAVHRINPTLFDASARSCFLLGFIVAGNVDDFEIVAARARAYLRAAASTSAGLVP